MHQSRITTRVASSLSVPAVHQGQVRQIWIHVLVLGEHSLVDVQSGPSFDSFCGCILLPVRNGCVYQLRQVLAELICEPSLLLRWIPKNGVGRLGHPGVHDWLDCCLARESFQDQLVGNFWIRVARLLLTDLAEGKVSFRLGILHPLLDTVGFVLELLLHGHQVQNLCHVVAQLLLERLRFLVLSNVDVSRQRLWQILRNLLQLRSKLRHSFRLEAGSCGAFLEAHRFVFLDIRQNMVPAFESAGMEGGGGRGGVWCFPCDIE